MGSLHYEDDVDLTDLTTQSQRQVIACDPGLNDCFTFVSLTTGKVAKLSSGSFHHAASMPRWKGKRADAAEEEDEAGPSQSNFDRRADAASRMEIMRERAASWPEREKQCLHRTAARRKQYFFQRRKAAFQRVVRAVIASFTEDGQGPPLILMGNCGRGWGRAHTKNSKPPVLELRRELARHVVVILCSEHRTSCCCLGCSTYLEHPKHDHDPSKTVYGVYVCRNSACPLHNIYVNRDISACFKIMARALAANENKNLGSFGKGNPVQESSVLLDKLKETGRFADAVPGKHPGRAVNILRPGFAVGKREQDRAALRKGHQQDRAQRHKRRRRNRKPSPAEQRRWERRRALRDERRDEVVTHMDTRSD